MNPFSVRRVDKKDVLKRTAAIPDDESAKRRAQLLQKYVMPHKNLVYSICIKYTYNQEDIEDNYVEALVNFYKYMDSYDPARQRGWNEERKRTTLEKRLKTMEEKKNGKKCKSDTCNC